MSHKTYDSEWKQVQQLLAETLQSEAVQVDRREQRQLLSTLYVRYILVSNVLSECVDQMVQPQKRRLIRKLLEATLGRILELKYDLVEADLSEWTHCGDVLEQLKLTPEQSELKVPSCFRNERRKELQYQKNLIESVLGKLGFLDKLETKPPMTEQQAILIIQVHERARQGRLRAQFMREIRNMKEKTKPVVGEEDDENEQRGGISLPAALRIQKIWRGYVARRATRRRKLQEMLLIGMIPPPKTQSAEILKDLEIKEYRRRLQEERQLKYENDVKKSREHMEKYQRGVVLEQLSDQVRGWLHEYKTQTGKIPEYTGSERAASRLLFSRQGTDSELSKSTQISSKDSKTKKDKGPKQKEAKQEGEEGEEVSTKAMVSAFVPELNARKEEYDEIWKNKDESENPKQFHYMNIIEHEQMTNMENELRKVVDEMMKGELLLLQEAMDKDRGHKGKKKSSKKTRKGGKKGKKKKEKDLTPDRTTESLFEELVANGIIKKCPDVYLDDFKGERSYSYPVVYNKGSERPIALGDMRQIVAEYCVLPLLSPQLHQTTPHIKSLMIAGPKGSGKDMLIHAVCNEAGAVLFDLTPSNIVGKYPGKSGLTMLIHLVVKVSRLLQPSVIYMDCAERPFVKKIPKTDKTDPKRLKKDLPKIVKNFSPEDRVMLIGVSSCPWESDQKLLQQVYQKFILVPKPDYSSRYCVWSYLLSKYSAISWQFDTSVVSKISDGFTIGSIVSTFEEVMTIKRMLQLRVHPLSPLELVNVLCKKTPIYKEEEEAIETWWSKTPLCRRRARAVEILLEEEAELQAKQASTKN
ncbi:dynein regulatory complex protein 11 [Tribolium madens]|uniref:dynein regulatory complex protein 11 n=1 Tax=Tribolium madens TaxID=41895 RepID=UPI001CF76363|nr:dynein regulatory complex protein 11 [Tribolium madens]